MAVPGGRFRIRCLSPSWATRGHSGWCDSTSHVSTNRVSMLFWCSQFCLIQQSPQKGRSGIVETHGHFSNNSLAGGAEPIGEVEVFSVVLEGSFILGVPFRFRYVDFGIEIP